MDNLDVGKISILKKLNTIMKEVKSMEKDGQNTFQNYSYLSETQVTLAMKKLLEKNGVVFTHDTEFISITEVSPTSKGTKQFMTTIRVRYVFCDMDTGGYVSGGEIGQGVDSQDKGIYKAITGAVKYIFMKTFLIPTGDDPENDEYKPIYNKTTAKTILSEDEIEKVLNEEALKAQEIFGGEIIDDSPTACSECKAKMTPKEINYSMSKFKKLLCYKCQHGEKK